MSPGRGSLEVADLDDDDEEEKEVEESDDDVRVLASARCCRRRGGDATINIRWEVGGGRVTQGGVEVDITCTFLSVDVNGDGATGYDNNDGDGATDDNGDGATDDDVRRDGRRRQQ